MNSVKRKAVENISYLQIFFRLYRYVFLKHHLPMQKKLQNQMAKEFFSSTKAHMNFSQFYITV